MSVPANASGGHGERTGAAPRRRLFWRVYLFGSFLLISAGLATALVGSAMGREGPRRDLPRRLTAYVAEGLGPSLNDPDLLRRELLRAGESLRMELSVYDDDGTRLGTTEEPAIEPLSASQVLSLAKGAIRVEDDEPPMPVLAAAIPGSSAYLVARLPRPDVPLERPAAILGAILVVLALVSFPFARSIAAPLERLTATAEQLGQGHLDVRSGLRREDEVGILAVALDEMAERLEILVRSEKELLANVSHELRTPLARIRVALELAQEGDLPEARRYLEEIGSDLVELDRLIEDVLLVARMDLGTSGAPPLRPETIDPRELVELSAKRFRAAYPERTLEVRIGEGIPAAIAADPMLLRRALDNLVDNARKYSDDEVIVELRGEGSFLELTVQDRGIGIDGFDLPWIFSPFFRTDRSRTRKTGGLGLGLTLARRIVEAHGGTLEAQSGAQVGTIFSIRIPLAVA
ncbi:sensor histidine kinase [Vulgatibacter incomptus]|uniref:histidine kinase n=1 Tax=Vulgatibacter incomptus TaxID=1391653 RepID=A0A0K1PG58_9BACT|nr:HAMP domain-containing sensor histidine kinase [Vulgatibacter incomptus]AKU92518.1 periplasmic sensor signal transduction histidine kinase [Vulgatibacter incomptus]